MADIITAIDITEQENAAVSKTSIFPNPTNDGIFNLSKSVNWKVYSMLGEELKSGFGNLINISDQPKGVYLIKINEKVERILYE